MKTPNKIAITIILLILAGAGLYQYVSSQSQKLVIFGQNMNGELREALIKRLETNKISYYIDDDGNVKISEKDVKKAIVCCS